MNTKPLLIKSAIGIAGVGGIGFAAHQGYQAFQTKSVREEKNNVKSKLKKEGYTPITRNSQHFDEILRNYKTVTESKNNLRFDTFTGDAPAKDSRQPKDILWEHCQNAFNGDVSDDLFNKTKKWCVEPISVFDMLTNRGHQKLDTVGSGEELQRKWDTKITKHRKQDNNLQKIDDLDIGADQAEITEIHRGNIKKKCNEIGGVRSYEDKYENNLGIFETWCIDN